MTGTLTGAGHVLGHLAAIGFLLALLWSGTTWIMGADRAQAVAGYDDGGAPRFFGVFSSRWGRPINVNLLSGTFSTIVMVLAFQLTSGSAAKYLTAVLGLAISTTTISYLLVFPALVKLRYARPRPAPVHRARRPRRRVDHLRPVHGLVDARHRRAAVSGLRDEPPGPLAAGRLGGPAGGPRGLAIRSAVRADRARAGVLRPRRADAAAPGRREPRRGSAAAEALA